jgi:hypothetical protein
MGDGVFLVQEVPNLMSLLYDTDRQCLIANVDPLNHTLHHFDNVVVNHKLLMTPGPASLEHPHTIHHVSPC